MLNKSLHKHSGPLSIKKHISDNRVLRLNLGKIKLPKRKAHWKNYRENLHRRACVQYNYGGGKVIKAEMPGEDR